MTFERWVLLVSLLANVALPVATLVFGQRSERRRAEAERAFKVADDQATAKRTLLLKIQDQFEDIAEASASATVHGSGTQERRAAILARSSATFRLEKLISRLPAGPLKESLEELEPSPSVAGDAEDPDDIDDDFDQALMDSATHVVVLARQAFEIIGDELAN